VITHPGARPWRKPRMSTNLAGSLYISKFSLSLSTCLTAAAEVPSFVLEHVSTELARSCQTKRLPRNDQWLLSRQVIPLAKFQKIVKSKGGDDLALAHDCGEKFCVAADHVSAIEQWKNLAEAGCHGVLQVQQTAEDYREQQEQYCEGVHAAVCSRHPGGGTRAYDEVCRTNLYTFAQAQRVKRSSAENLRPEE